MSFVRPAATGAHVEPNCPGPDSAMPPAVHGSRAADGLLILKKPLLAGAQEEQGGVIATPSPIALLAIDEQDMAIDQRKTHLASSTVLQTHTIEASQLTADHGPKRAVRGLCQVPRRCLRKAVSFPEYVPATLLEERYAAECEAHP